MTEEEDNVVPEEPENTVSDVPLQLNKKLAKKLTRVRAALQDPLDTANPWIALMPEKEIVKPKKSHKKRTDLSVPNARARKKPRPS